MSIPFNRRKTDETHRRSQERFRAAMDAVNGVLWTTNAKGEMEGEQPAWGALTNQSLEQYEGYGWATAVHAEDAQPTLEAWAKAVSSRSVFVHEHRVQRHDGQWRLFAVRAVPVRNEDGSVREWVGVHTDITDRRRTEDSLREADRRKDEFLATLAHELRNPLAPIRQAVQIARAPGSTEAQRRWSLAVIDRQVSHMALLLGDLLDASRITEGKLQLRLESVDLAALIDSGVETAQPLIDARHQRLDLELPERPVYLHADALRLAQVVANLLTNAAKYSNEGDRILLTALCTEASVEIRVRDSGIGIDPALLEQVFDMFSQSTAALERADGGLGIGLALVKGIVALHGGTVQAHSEGLGTGSEFVVRLPTSLLSAVPPRISETQRFARAAAGLTVVVADDNKDSAESLKVLLELEGHSVQTAHDGAQAFAAIEQTRPQVALLDIGMPELNGYEVAAKVRSQPWGSRLRLIALTGWGQLQDRKRALEAGFDHHLTKPVNPDEVTSLVSRAHS